MLTPLRGSDGTWQRLKDEWAAQCAAAGEDFATYSAGGFSVVESLALQDEARAGVYGLIGSGSHQAICQVNCAPLPGYDGPVLRARFMTLAPRYDFGDLSVDDYAHVLVGLFGGIINLSNQAGPMLAKHVKFHLASPADRPFFAALGTQLDRASVFATVSVRGAWLYVTKNQ